MAEDAVNEGIQNVKYECGSRICNSGQCSVKIVRT